MLWRWSVCCIVGFDLFSHAGAQADQCDAMDAMIENVNVLCCNGGANGGAHRRAQDECLDDPSAVLAGLGIDCSTALASLPGCDFVAAIPGVPVGTPFSFVCPATCAACGGGNSDSSSCVLGTCSPSCAQNFVTLLDDCEDRLPLNGDGFSVLSEIPGADDFLETCQHVLDSIPAPEPAGTEPDWITEYNWFATADPGMLNGALSSGTGALGWGLWRYDPGPTGVQFSQIPQLEQNNVAPMGWNFDRSEWWVEEHGRIMETPESLPAGRYKVQWLNCGAWGAYCPCGDTHHACCPEGETCDLVDLIIDGDNWSLGSTAGMQATLHDVTHLPCRSAVYTPLDGASTDSCMPHNIDTSEFPVAAGAAMPNVPGCNKVDYAVLFVRKHL